MASAVSAGVAASVGRCSVASERSTVSGCCAAVESVALWSVAAAASGAVACYPPADGCAVVAAATAGHGDPSAANDGAPMHAKSPTARIHAAGLLALIVISAISVLPVPQPERDLRRCPQRGKKVGIFRRFPAKAGQFHASRAGHAQKPFGISARRN